MNYNELMKSNKTKWNLMKLMDREKHKQIIKSEIYYWLN